MNRRNFGLGALTDSLIHVQWFCIMARLILTMSLGLKHGNG
jgi:hypothetical protein